MRLATSFARQALHLQVLIELRIVADASAVPSARTRISSNAVSPLVARVGILTVSTLVVGDGFTLLQAAPYPSKIARKGTSVPDNVNGTCVPMGGSR